MYRNFTNKRKFQGGTLIGPQLPEVEYGPRTIQVGGFRSPNPGESVFDYTTAFNENSKERYSNFDLEEGMFTGMPVEEIDKNFFYDEASGQFLYTKPTSDSGGGGMVDSDGDGMPDYIEADAGKGTNQPLPGVVGGPSLSGVTGNITYNVPSGMQPAGPIQASTFEDAPTNMRERILNRRSNRLDEKIAKASAGEESVMDKAAGALESLGIYNVADAGKYLEAFTDSPERALARAGYNKGTLRGAGNIVEASTSLLGSFLQGFGSYEKTGPMTEEEYIAAKKAEQDKKNNTVMIGDTRYTLVEDSEGRMTIGPEYQETQTAQDGKVIGMQDFLNPNMYNPFAMQGQPANPPNPLDLTGSDNQLLTGVQPVTGIQSNLLTGDFMTGPTNFSSTVDITTDSDGDGIPDYQDDFDNSIVSEEERQKDIKKAQASLFGTAAALGSSVGGNDLGVQAARAGMMGKRILEGDNTTASLVGLLSGAGSIGFGAARTKKGPGTEVTASADARKRAAEQLRQGIVTGGTKGRMELANEPFLQASTGDPMATESQQEGTMIGYSNGGVAQGGQTPPLPKGAVVGPLTARYFNRTAPVSNKGLVDFPNQPVIVNSNQLTMVEAEAGGELPDLVAAYPDGDPSIVMEKGKRYSFPNSTQVLEIPLNQALYG